MLVRMVVGGGGGGHTDFKFTFIGRFPSNGAASMAMKRVNIDRGTLINAVTIFTW